MRTHPSWRQQVTRILVIPNSKPRLDHSSAKTRSLQRPGILQEIGACTKGEDLQPFSYLVRLVSGRAFLSTGSAWAWLVERAKALCVRLGVHVSVACSTCLRTPRAGAPPGLAIPE